MIKGPEHFSEALANRTIGVCHQARWVNPAAHILSLHVRDPNPSIWLEKAVEYIVYVYCPTIFNVSMDPHVTNGPIHLFNMFKSARDLLKKPISRGDKKCALCLKYFPVNLKKHIKEVHDGLNNPWELWLGGFFSNNWFMHIGKRKITNDICVFTFSFAQKGIILFGRVKNLFKIIYLCFK